MTRSLLLCFGKQIQALVTSVQLRKPFENVLGLFKRKLLKGVGLLSSQRVFHSEGFELLHWETLYLRARRNSKNVNASELSSAKVCSVYFTLYMHIIMSIPIFHYTYMYEMSYNNSIPENRTSFFRICRINEALF